MTTKSAIVSGMGLAMSIVQVLVKAVQAAGGTDEDIHRLATPEGEGLLAKVAEIIVSRARQTFKVLVDYGKSLQEMVAAGNYDWVHSDIISDHFPIQGSDRQEVEVTLFHFNKAMKSEDVITEMKKQGFRPAKLEELLVLGASQPELQKQFPIVALGSVWRNPGGNRRVPYLDWSGARRLLRLSWFGRGWSGFYRFVAVRNAS